MIQMILFFDTETTGLPLSWKRPYTEVENWPRVIQVAWLLYDLRGELKKSRMAIIYPQGFDIPEEASAIHGINTEMACEKGEFIEDILLEFDADLEGCEEVVAHNIAFDEKVMMAEYCRMKQETFLMERPRRCTMRSATRFCAIPHAYGRMGYKWPKLSELHIKLFGEDFEGAHDALADIEATARCYWKLKDLHLM
jgi:DNA polymerase III epsilon subunit-like protein